MHEEPYAQALLDLALAQAQGRRVTALRLKVGRLAAILPESLEVFFRALARGGPAQDARLEVEWVPVEMVCRSCGAVRLVDQTPELNIRRALALAHARPCACGALDWRMAGGMGCDLASIQVADAP